MKRLFRLPVLIFLAGLLLGALVYFPFRIFTPQIEKALSRQGIDAQLGDLHLGTGLGLGIGRGGIFALKGTNVNLNFSGGRSLACHEFLLSPQWWALVTAKFRVTAACETEREGNVTTVMSLSPIWSPSQIRADIYMENLRLQKLSDLLGINAMTGTANGKVSLQMPLTTPTNGSKIIPSMAWDAQGTKVTLPSVTSGIFNLPNIPIDELALKGRLSANGQAEIQELRFGTKTSPIEGQIHGSFAIDQRQGIPTSTDIRGSLRTDANFEKTELRDVNLDLLFGKVKESGQREFHKVAKGSPLGLLFEPPLDN